MAARSKARKRALDVLFEAEARKAEAQEILTRERMAGEVNPYVRELVEGVLAHQERIDELISSNSNGWELDRMPAVDRNVLRIGAYELLWGEEIPLGVAISEAVELVKKLSTDDSPAFVNGVLMAIANEGQTRDNA